MQGNLQPSYLIAVKVLHDKTMLKEQFILFLFIILFEGN